MWKLTIEDDEGSQTSLQLAAAEYHIGRDEGNNVRLTDRNVSRRHATIKRNGDETWHLVDHESYNGSYVNGQRVAGSSSLGHADLIQLGDYRIFLTNEERVLAPPSPGKPATSSVPPTPEYPDRLVVLVGPEPGFECRLDRGVVTIGRSEECTFAINHPSVSRVHAVVHPVAPGRFEVLDKESANGLRINGVDMRRKILEGGDVIELGDVQMRYFEQGQAPRLGSEISQRVRAFPPAPSGDPASARASGPTSERPRRPGTGRWVVIALGVAAVGAGIVAFQTRPRVVAGSDPPTAAPTDDATTALIERARTAARPDPAEALRLLSTLPESSPRRRSTEVSEVAGLAANAILAEAAKEPDPGKRAPALKPLLSHPLVGENHKAQANQLLRPIESSVPPAPVRSTEVTPKASSGGKEPRVQEGGEPPAGEGPRVASTRTKEREGRDREGATKPPTRPKEREGRDREGAEAVDLSQATERSNLPVIKRSIEGRLNSGKATIDELRMLKAICQQDGDSACKERAQEAIRKQSE